MIRRTPSPRVPCKKCERGKRDTPAVRFVGTALGAVVAAIAASHFGPHLFVFGTSVFILGLLCAVSHADQSAYRFGGVALAIVLLVPRAGSAWQLAFHRFAEVSIGIGVALILAVVWPERDVTRSPKILVLPSSPERG